MLQLNLQLIGDALSGAGIELPAAEEESLPAWGSRQIVLVKKRKVYAQARAEQGKNNENNQACVKAFPPSTRWR